MKKTKFWLSWSSCCHMGHREHTNKQTNTYYSVWWWLSAVKNETECWCGALLDGGQKHPIWGGDLWAESLLMWGMSPIKIWEKSALCKEISKGGDMMWLCSRQQKRLTKLELSKCGGDVQSSPGDITQVKSCCWLEVSCWLDMGLVCHPEHMGRTFQLIS